MGIVFEVKYIAYLLDNLAQVVSKPSCKPEKNLFSNISKLSVEKAPDMTS